MRTLNVVRKQSRGLAWPAWQERNRIKDEHGLDMRSMLTKFAAVAALLVIILSWSYAADLQIWVRLAVCAGAVRVAFLAASARQYAWVALFAGMALLYNPVVPVFPFSGRLYLIIVMASVAPFAASLFALRPQLARPASTY